MTQGVITPDIFHRLPVTAFFTTKTLHGGLETISKMLGIPSSQIYLPIQKHTDKIVLVDYDLGPRIGDAVITNRRGILIGVQVADCVPILLYDRRTGVIGAVHAGWRGTAEAILKKTINRMVERFSSVPADILIALGPGIRWCCYAVGPEVLEAVKKATGTGDYITKKGEKYCLDLPAANRYQAISSGVLGEHIGISEECTFCIPERYYSYRYAKGPTGRQYGLIGFLDIEPAG